MLSRHQFSVSSGGEIFTLECEQCGKPVRGSDMRLRELIDYAQSSAYTICFDCGEDYEEVDLKGRVVNLRFFAAKHNKPLFGEILVY